MPWIERDYTPVSTAKEWERGTCDLLVKVYEQGAARRGCSGKRRGQGVSHVETDRNFTGPRTHAERKGGVVPPKVHAANTCGDGVVALPQLLRTEIREQTRNINPRRDQMKDAPITLFPREDDVLMTPELTRWCREGAAGPVSSPFGTTYARAALHGTPDASVMTSGAGCRFQAILKLGDAGRRARRSSRM